MKKSILLALLLCVSTLCAADVTGFYSGKGATADQKYGSIGSDFQIGLTQAGSSITGFLIQGKADPVKFDSGAVSGNQVTISLTQGTVVVTGLFTVDGSMLTGRLTGSDGQVYTIALNRQ